MKPILLFSAAALAAGFTFTLAAPFAGARGHGGGFGNWGGPNSTQPGQNDKSRSLTQTVVKDQLTDKEVSSLKEQETELDKAAATYAGDAKLTKDDFDALEASLDAASFSIWSKGLDDDGKIVTRYGKSIFPIDALNKVFEDKSITRPQAKILMTALKSLVTEKLKLNELMTVESRIALQKQFNDGLAKYYMVK